MWQETDDKVVETITHTHTHTHAHPQVGLNLLLLLQQVEAGQLGVPTPPGLSPTQVC